MTRGARRWALTMRVRSSGGALASAAPTRIGLHSYGRTARPRIWATWVDATARLGGLTGPAKSSGGATVLHSSGKPGRWRVSGACEAGEVRRTPSTTQVRLRDGAK